MEKVLVTLPSGESVSIPDGTTLGELLKQHVLDSTEQPVAAIVNNEILDLSRRVRINATVRPVYLSSDSGIRCYRRSLCFLLALASRKVFPARRLVIGHSLGDAYYYDFDDDQEIGEHEIASLRHEMRRIVEEDIPIQRRLIAYEDAVEYFKRVGMTETAALLQHQNSSRIAVYRCGDFTDVSHGPLVPCSGVLRHFDLNRLDRGFVLRFPSRQHPSEVGPYQHSPQLFSIYQEYKEWGKILGITSAGSLNQKTSDGTIGEFIRVNEALHEKKIADIADSVASRTGEVRVVLIAGPSSSGKTTFTKKLAVQLMAHGLEPVLISVDDYFLDHDETPRDENGELDFESVHAVDIKLLNENLIKLFESQKVEIPSFDFKSGSRKYDGRSLQLGERSIVLVEGIHCLNDQLTVQVEPERKFKVYISALTQLNLDDHNRIPTTDNRLIRRMVRDHQFRGHSAIDTLEMWPSVQRGEHRNIFPYQDSADTAFNSALDYELGVLKKHAEPLLLGVKPYDDVYNEAVRLLSFLSNFTNIPDKLVPDYSILREFVGDSGFHY